MPAKASIQLRTGLAFIAILALAYILSLFV